MKKSPPVLALAPARAGEKAILNNLFFVGDQAVLLKTSEPELPKAPGEAKPPATSGL